MSFDHPLVLVALVALPLLVLGWLGLERRRASQATAFSSPALIPNLVSSRPGRRRIVPLALFLTAIALLVMGMARPHATISVPRKEATIMIAVDVSRSMSAKDVQPTRLAAAQKAAIKFLDQVPPEYSIGVIGFGTRAFVALPPTVDRVLARDALDGLAPSEGTAIGDAVALGVRVGQRLKSSDGTPMPTSMLLISDGARDGGRTSPLVSARRARSAGIPVSTVLVGTQNGIVTNKLVGGYEEQIRVPPSPGTLQAIARLSLGDFFRSRTSDALTTVYKKLSTRVGHKSERREITDFFAAGAAVLLVAGGGLSALWFRRLVP